MDNLEVFKHRKDALFELIKEAFIEATKAHELLFKEPNGKQNEIIAALYLNKAISLMSAARSLYLSNYEILMRHEIENIFHTFNVFESEFLSNISTGHSHQWTDLEFLRFKESVEAFIV